MEAPSRAEKKNAVLTATPRSRRVAACDDEVKERGGQDVLALVAIV
jgi:hypothetical protein